MRKNFGTKPYMYPMPVLIIGSYDENGVPNAMNAAWGGIADYKKVSLYLKDPILKNDISGIVTDLDSAKKFKIVSNILMDCDFSVQYLNKIGFNWPEINK